MKKVCVITGTRAEYGLLKPLARKIKSDNELELQIIVTGMHLSPEFGLTYLEIEKDDFLINEKVETLLSSDSPVGISKSIGLGVIGFADALERLKPDMVVVLGDRYEIFAAASAALVHRIPIAHLHGGETGAGTIDNMIRHAITKLSSLHFTATEEYRKRVIQLGENPDKVYNVGALGIENIKELKLLKKEELEKDLNFAIDDKTILFTYHTLSLEYDLIQKQITDMLSALDQIEGIRIIFTMSNSDTGGRIINDTIEKYVQTHPQNTAFYASLGVLRYLSAAKYVKAVVGNSSSGVIEIPSLKTYTLNIGKRQEGRMQADTVINSEATKEDVYNKLCMILEKPVMDTVNNPYEKEETSTNILKAMKKWLKRDGLSDKVFHDL